MQQQHPVRARDNTAFGADAYLCQTAGIYGRNSEVEVSFLLPLLLLIIFREGHSKLVQSHSNRCLHWMTTGERPMTKCCLSGKGHSVAVSQSGESD